MTIGISSCGVGTNVGSSVNKTLSSFAFHSRFSINKTACQKTSGEYRKTDEIARRNCSDRRENRAPGGTVGQCPPKRITFAPSDQC